MRFSELFMNNVAEGFGSISKFEFIQFLSISRDSTNELKSQLIQSL
jgi:four helix bundle protein